MTDYTLGWEIKNRASDKTTLSAGTAVLKVSDSFVFGVRAAYATIKFGDIAFSLKEYNDGTTIIQFILAQAEPDVAEVNNLSGDQLLDVYLNGFVVAEDEFTDKFEYPNIPPNVAFMIPLGDNYSSGLIKLQNRSENCTYAIALGNQKSEEGYTLIAVPDKFDVNEFLSGFCFVHKQFAIANAKRESYVAEEHVKVTDIPEEFRTHISLLKFAAPVQLSTEYRYRPDGSIAGLDVVSKERVDYY